MSIDPTFFVIYEYDEKEYDLGFNDSSGFFILFDEEGNREYYRINEKLGEFLDSIKEDLEGGFTVPSINSGD